MHLKHLLFTGFLLPFLGLAGCNEPASDNSAPQAYFDVPGFMNEQIQNLEKEHVGLQKTVGIGHAKPETHQLKTVNWPEELALFQEIDLNKKALAGNYTETRTPFAGGEKLSYTRNPDSRAPITFLEIITGNQNRVKQLRAIYTQENALFFNREERLLQTDPEQKITGYQISGVQKVLFFDSLHYQVQSTLP